MTPVPARPSTASKRRPSSWASWLLLAVVVLLLDSDVLAQPRVYASLARPRAEIAVDYPFDIQLTASRGIGDTLATESGTLLGQHLGERPVVLLFWMTTCGPCRRELADLEAVIDEWQAQADFAFVPVSLDFPLRRDDFHARAAAYPWPSYFDERREFPLVMPGGLNGVPQIFVFDAAGEQVFHRRKYRPGDLASLAHVLGVK